ncbi:MAG: dTDP-4-dehydrorhamnose reductase [Victivallales bacterium]|nr:dTDP-4-dehydrorhamnose reductase [Victivallales bacterium]
MRIVVTGGRGMLARTLLRTLGIRHEVVPVDVQEADITDAAGVNELFARLRPETVIHCAAMTQVDDCEAKRDLAFRVNAEGAGNVAAACERQQARLISISTDYVFSGKLDRPYRESDPAEGAQTVYGQSKRAGELQVLANCPGALICRISWLYGPGGPSFVHTMLRLADGSRPLLKVVNDQHGNPTSTLAVAGHLALLLERPEIDGILHLTCEGDATWYEFAQEIFRLKGISQAVVPCATAEFPRPAPRPPNSRLEKARLRELGLPPMPDWHAALKQFLALSSS